MTETLYRTLPPTLAPIVAELEFRSADIVSASEIADIARLEPGSAALRDIVRRLTESRWLRRLPVRGRYEFLPSRGGPLSRGDRLDPLRAALASRPQQRVQVALHAAAFLRGFADRQPSLWDVLVDRLHPVSKAMQAEYRIHRVRSDRLFGAPDERGVPVSSADRLLIDVALWPDIVGRSLRARDHWLGAALRQASTDTVVEMLTSLDSPAVTARAGYLAERFGQTDIADGIAKLPRSRIAVSLLPASLAAPVIQDRRFNVVDPIGAGAVA